MKLFPDADGRVDIRGVRFDNVTEDTASAAIIEYAKKDGGDTAAVFTPNSEIVQRCVEDRTGELYGVINSAALIVPDSTGIVKAAKMFGTPVTGKVAGVELGERVLRESAKEGIPVYFLGGKPGVADDAKAKMTEKYPGLRVVGTADGYFDKTGAESDARIADIARTGARILYVCLGAPAQERWIYDNRDALTAAGVRIAMGLGGALDVYAGNVKRAPKLFLALGLEWLYRLLREPKRLGRMMALPRFYLGCRREAKKSKPKKHRAVRIMILIAVVIGIAASAAALIIDSFVRSAADGRIVTVDQAGGLDGVDLILVLGAGVKKDGRPSDMLADRIKVGVELYESGASDVILMSGDGAREGYDEPAAMRSAAIDSGVPDAAIVCDTLGLSTYESILRARDVYGAKKIVIVTQKYHLYRALYLADKFGVEAVGVSADLRPYRGQAFRELREILARSKDFLITAK